jgi:hypothetical protein
MRRELVDTKRELQGAESDYEQMGWEVVDRSPGRIVVERGRRGSWPWHLLYFAILPVYGNLLYSAYRRYNRPQRLVIRIRGFAEGTSPPDESGEEVEE